MSKSDIMLYVSATTPDYKPNRAETIARVVTIASAFGFGFQITAAEPVQCVYRGEAEKSVILTLEGQHLVEVRRLAARLARHFDQECVMLVTEGVGHDVVLNAHELYQHQEDVEADCYTLHDGSMASTFVAVPECGGANVYAVLVDAEGNTRELE